VNIAITGATGFVGTKLVDLALRRGHEVVALTRNPTRKIPGCEMRAFSLDAAPDLTRCEAVVHLAGESVFGLWTSAKKRRIRESRVLGTRRVVEAIQAAKERPEVFVCGSGIGVYEPDAEAELTESAPHGTNFLAEVVEAWEAEAMKATPVRTVLLRTGLALGRGGGALQVMSRVFTLGLGGPAGNGRQWVSWIHLEDLAMLILFAIENLEVAGPMNATAPWPVRNAELTETLARVLHRPAIFRAPAWALRLALNEFSRELLDSKRVVPAVAAGMGFRFKYPELEGALRDLVG
jgi:uncharacterized protein (TIGR01777 family)